MNNQAVSFTTRSVWLNCLLAWLAGGLATLSLSPYDAWPVLFVSYTLLVWLMDGASLMCPTWRGRFCVGFATGWCFAFGYFVPSLWWISEAFWVEPEKFAALIPLAVAGLPSYLAVYWGLACAVAAALWVPGWSRIVLLAVLVGIGEWLRGHLLTGFPWNLPGYGVSAIEGFAQTASIIGIYGLSVLVVLVAASPAALWYAGKRTPCRLSFAFLVVVLGLAAGLHLWGVSRIASYNGLPNGDATLVRIIQPNISQQEKWKPENTQRIIDTYLSMTSASFENLLTSPPLIVWPESALPRLLGEEDVLRAEIVASLPNGSHLLTGGLHRVTAQDGQRSIYNSLLAMSPQGLIEARHDKVRLVPFGEFLPFSWLLEPIGVRQLVKLPPGFAAGSEDRVVNLPGLPAFAGFICYEAAFPRSLPYATRPRVLVNATNDAWFGTSGGPHQHLAHARFRAIEQGVVMIRAANTGISAVIDAHGRIVGSLGLGAAGRLDIALPPEQKTTIYAKAGDLAFLALLALIMLLHLICRRTKSF